MIERVLVANRGEIAARIFHTLREMGIDAVAVFTDADEDAVHRHAADQAWRIRDYLDVSDLLDAARGTGASAIHPGYGFLSENADFAEAVTKAGLIFIGPNPETIRVMGDKLESKRLMADAGVPTLPTWDGPPPESEYPVLVKAVGGGGGKGMRLVEAPDELDAARESAARESEKAFGDARVFVEKYVEEPRHIEIQILGDSHGNTIHVFERECSIQRRHQKIIEETPSPALDADTRQSMGNAALEAAKAVNYLGAGTVEFILDPSGAFYFLEMNTRLQVEHPVTEATTGQDLVREQIRIAGGEAISVEQESLGQTGHAIECRIYAEDPAEGYRPATGSIEIFRPPRGPGIRLDSGIEQGSTVGFQYDPLLAKLIVWGPDRTAAIARMRRALGDFVLLGLRTNIDFLGQVISSEGFGSGKFDTHFLDRHPELLAAPEVPVAAFLAASIGAQTGTARRPESGADAFPDVWQNRDSWRNT